MTFRELISEAKEAILDFLFVPACPVCRNVDEIPICNECKKRLQKVFYPWDIVRREMHFDHAISAFEYKGFEVLRLVQSVKFRGVDFGIAVAGEAMYSAVCQNRNYLEADLITWIPRSEQALIKRGFDQSELLANYLSERMGIPCKKLLARAGTARVQHKLNRAERSKNVEGAFVAVEKNFGGVVILIDDVITSGATVNEGARILKKAGFDRVRCLSLASVDPREK